MKDEAIARVNAEAMSRRAALGAIGTAAGVAAFVPQAFAQAAPAPNAMRVDAPSVISNPPRDFSPGHPVTYPDPDIVTIDPAFAPLRVNNTSIQRLFTGGCERRIVPLVGHNLPQEAPRDFADAVLSPG